MSLSQGLSAALLAVFPPPLPASAFAPRRWEPREGADTSSSSPCPSLRRSYLTPVRDEEAESLRKARSRQARQTRRSTQVGVASFLYFVLSCPLTARASPTRDWSAGLSLTPAALLPGDEEQRGSAVLGDRAGKPAGPPRLCTLRVDFKPVLLVRASFGAGMWGPGQAGPSLICPLSPGRDSDRPAGGRKDLQPVSGGAAGSGPAWPEAGYRRAGGPRREA